MDALRQVYFFEVPVPENRHFYETSREYKSWCAMKSRCLNPNATGYKNYGGRGITIDPEWLRSFAAFYRDMGPRPIGSTLDRINNDGNYCKENCRWATRKEQASNRRPLPGGAPQRRKTARAEIIALLKQRGELPEEAV